jgi:hypothetical protein
MKRSSLGLTLSVTVGLMLSSTRAFADAYTFGTDPSSGDIQGPAGSTIGWGYSITNDSTTDWLVTTNLAADVFLDATPDASPFDFPIIAPLTTVTLPYDALTDTGLFALTWSATAPAGFTNSGLFTLSAEWWTGDPLSGGAFIDDAANETAAYLATVSPAASTTPEPSYSILLIFILGLLCWKARRRVLNE